jgi:tRNA (adenine22-N1)-methyltransferase
MKVNELKLSQRLLTVANHIPKDAILADIGSDHAYLPCYAALKGLIKRGIAGELNDGPYRSAQNQVTQLKLQQIIKVRKGNGFEVIAPKEVTTVTIAGMGGQLIQTILENGKDKLDGVERLILQPNVGAHVVRNWLYENGWQLIAEDIIEEDDKIYEVLVAVPGDGKKPYRFLAIEILVGPFLLKQRGEVFVKKWTQELDNWNRIYEQMKQAAPNDELQKRKANLLQTIQTVEEVLNDETSKRTDDHSSV